MNTEHTPSANDLLHAYIDGELHADLEQQFFSILAIDGDLRTRLRQYRAIRTESLAYGAPASPPASVSEQLFSRLGLAPQEDRRSAGIILPLFSAAWAPIASAAAAAFITAVIMLGLSQGPVQNADTRLAQSAPVQQSDSRETGSARMQTQTGGESTTRTTHDVHTTAAQQSPEALRSPADTRQHSNAPDPAATASTHGDVIVSSTETAQSSDRTPTSVLASRHETEPVRTSSQTPADQHPPSSYTDWETVSAVESSPLLATQQAMTRLQDGRVYYPVYEPGRGIGILTLEMRGVTATSFPRATIASNPAPWMENMAVSVFRSGEQTDIGLEYGQEAFSQHYSGVEHGKFVRYEQNLRSSWLVGTLRYRLSPLQSLAGIEPYATISAGGTFEVWPLVKGGFGLMYMPDRRVRFHCGLEGAILAFPYQGQWFTSKRAGLTYGLSVLF